MRLDVEAVVLDLDVEVVPEDAVRTTRPAASAFVELVLEDEVAELARRRSRSGR